MNYYKKLLLSLVVISLIIPLLSQSAYAQNKWYDGGDTGNNWGNANNWNNDTRPAQNNRVAIRDTDVASPSVDLPCIGNRNILPGFNANYMGSLGIYTGTYTGLNMSSNRRVITTGTAGGNSGCVEINSGIIAITNATAGLVVYGNWYDNVAGNNALSNSSGGVQLEGNSSGIMTSEYGFLSTLTL